MTHPTTWQQRFKTLALISSSVICGVLLGGAAIINILELQNFPVLPNGFPELLEIQQATESATLLGCVGIGLIFIANFVPQRKKKEILSVSER